MQIINIQNELLEKTFLNSFFKLSQRQLNIFETTEQRKEYINYLIFSTLGSLHLSFVQSIGYHDRQTIDYQVNKGKIIIPKDFIQDNSVIQLLPLISALVEYKNLHNFGGETDYSLLLNLVNRNLQLIFKCNELLDTSFERNLSIAYKDYFEEKALDFMIRQDKMTPELIENIPNIELCYKTINYLMIKDNRSYIVFNQ